MKCVIKNKNATFVFETEEIAYLKKYQLHYSLFDDDYCIVVSFKNGKSETFGYKDANSRDEEWEYLMNCWNPGEERDALQVK